MTIPTRTAKLMNAIPGAHKVWPEWFWPCCEVCGDEGEHSVAPERDNEPVIVCLKCKRDIEKPVYPFSPPMEGDGEWVIWNGDLTDKRNLWAVWEVAKHLSAKHLESVELVEWGRPSPWRKARCKAAVDGNTADHDQPQLALLAACEAAVKGVTK